MGFEYLVNTGSRVWGVLGGFMIVMDFFDMGGEEGCCEGDMSLSQDSLHHVHAYNSMNRKFLNPVSAGPPPQHPCHVNRSHSSPYWHICT